MRIKHPYLVLHEALCEDFYQKVIFSRLVVKNMN